MVNGSRNAPIGSAGFLAGLRVLELSGGLAGSFCGRLFADAGADVIKIEPPGGDPSRMHGPFAGNVPHHETSLRFLAVNAGKRSLVLDPDSERDQERLGALTAKRRRLDRRAITKKAARLATQRRRFRVPLPCTGPRLHLSVRARRPVSRLCSR